MQVPAEFAAWEYLDAGVKYMQAKNFWAAIANFDEALSYKSDDVRSHWNKALSLLSVGNYVQGFEELEWRWKLFDWGWGYLDRSVYRVEVVPQWRGETLTGKRVLLYHEQGLGDAIMMARYIPMLQVMGAEITLLTVAPLARLMATRFSIDVTLTVADDLTAFDYRCALFDPMKYLDQTVLTLPRQPYIRTDHHPIAGTMGLVWSGNTQQLYTLETFIQKIERSKHSSLFALQFGTTSSEVEPLVAQDFVDTLAVISCMETIVTVDTSVAHLAGACGHPQTHLILPALPDWRWYHAYAWYPTLHVHHDLDSLNKALGDK